MQKGPSQRHQGFAWIAFGAAFETRLLYGRLTLHKSSAAGLASLSC